MNLLINIDELEKAARQATATQRCIISTHGFDQDESLSGSGVSGSIPLPNTIAEIRAERNAIAMHQGSCHCGAVKLTLPATPDVATSCNCSLCRRIGGPWVYFEFGTVEIEGHPENTAEYVQGDRTLRTIRCRTCGCVTHWEPINLTPGTRHGVHLGNFDPELIASVRVRKFDGADTWKFLDELDLRYEQAEQGEA